MHCGRFIKIIPRVHFCSLIETCFYFPDKKKEVFFVFKLQANNLRDRLLFIMTTVGKYSKIMFLIHTDLKCDRRVFSTAGDCDP